MCEGGFKNVGLKLVDGRGVWTKHCYQCGGFWFERQPVEFLDLESVKKVDVSAPNYSIKNLDLVCPNDNSLLSPVERNELPAGAKSWRCPDCEGVFYPKGQLGLLTDHHHAVHGDQIAGVVSARSKTTLAGVLAFIGFAAVFATWQSAGVSYNAAIDQVLPTSGPNIITLLLLGLTYLAGVVLAVLGRRLPIVLVGWSVISVCLISFAVIIFGP